MSESVEVSAFDYSIFGLRVRSSLPLPELFPAIGDGQPDVTVETAAVADEQCRGSGLRAVEDALVLDVPEVARFRISGGNKITVAADSGAPQRNIRLYLLGSAFGALLHQRGLLPLHANGVEIDGKAVAFMGASGEGKSTLAAWFHDQGHRIIADDVCVVGFEPSGEPYATPGPPRLRLWADALELTGRNAVGLERSYIGHVDEKYDVPVSRARAAQSKIPLAALYLLERGENWSIDPINGVEAADAIFANTYRGSYVAAAGGQREHWLSCVQLVRRLPVFRISRVWNVERFGEQWQLLLDHIRQSATGVAATDGFGFADATARESTSICIGCGLCCDGTLHGTATVKPDDELNVANAGLVILDDGQRRYFQQPCSNFSCGRCSIYGNRPSVCRGYRCALLEKVQDGLVSETAAREKISMAKGFVAAVRRTEPEARTPAQRMVLARRLKGELAHLEGEEKNGVAKALLDTAVLEHFLNSWFLKDDSADVKGFGEQ